MKLIGFDATEDHRTFAGGGKLTIRNGEKGIPKFTDRYEVRYPLREWGMSREECGREITSFDLPLPPKSACFFCPAMKTLEIEQLKRQEPDLYALAIEMERVYRDGQHFKGDDFWTVRAKHKQTGESELHTCQASDAAAARASFRRHIKDTQTPHKYGLHTSRAVRGLGRKFSWGKLGEA